MSFFFAQNQLKTDSDNIIQQQQTDDDKSTQELLKTTTNNLDEKIDLLKQEIINELRKQEIVINSTLLKQLNENKDKENNDNYEFFSFLIYIPYILFANIWKFIGIIPYIGQLVQLLIIINVICLIFSIIPKIATSIFINMIKYIIFNLLPVLFSPLINSCKAVIHDSAFVELRHLVAYFISQIKDLLLSDMFQGVYNTKILSSFNISSFNISSLKASEVLGDSNTATVSDTYNYLKDSISKLF